MRLILVLCTLAVVTVSAFAAELSARDVVTQFYEAHQSSQDPLQKTNLLGRYLDDSLLKLFLRDKQEAKGEVGRLDGDPLYHAQEIQIKDFKVSPAETVNGETRVTVRFSNLGKPNRLVYLLTNTKGGWRISDIRYSDGSSLKKILQSDS